MSGWTEVGRFLILPWLLSLPCVSQVRHPLPVLWLMPVTAPPGQENLTAAVEPAIELALQDLRRQPPPLGSYEIHFDLLDSQCDSAKGLKALFDAMWSGPDYLLVFGGVCPAVTALMAQSLPALNLVQLSFAATSPVLAEGDRYPNFFSTVPSDGTVNQAVVKTLRYYEWSRVGILTQEKQRFSEMKIDLMKRLMEADVQVAATESLSRDPCVNLKHLKDNDVRIIIGQFEEDSASEVFCCAYRLNMFGRKYQWVLAGQSKARWWLDLPASGCTSDSLLTAMEGSISLDIQHLSDGHTKGISGRTPLDYKKAFLSEPMRDGLRGSLLHGFAYDAVWVMAKALSRVMEAVKHREKYSIHRNFTISRKKMSEMLLDSMKQTQFEGVTGPVLFRDGERMTLIELSQFQGDREVVMGKYDTYTQELNLIHHRIKFRGGRPAKDRTFVQLKERNISVVLYSILSSATALTIIIVLTVHCFTIKNRKHRLQKASGQSMDHLLILSILLTCSSIFLSGLDGALVSDQVFEVLCSKESWAHKPNTVVAGMLLLDVAGLSVRQVIDPLRRAVSDHSLEADPNGEDITIQPFSEHCDSTNMDLWLTVVYGYKGPLLGLGCFLAWNIRHVQEEHPLSDSKRLALSMCAVTISCCLGASSSLLTYRQPNVQFCLTTLAVLFCNTSILVLVFGPKLLYVRTNGNEVEQTCEFQCGPEKACGQLDGSCSQQDFSSSASSGVERLHSEKHHLRRRITQLDVELETVTRQLHENQNMSTDLSHDTAGEERSLELIHEAQICPEDGPTSGMKPIRTEEDNSPEHVERRLSLQLPILHHAYLPVIGGVTASCSSLTAGPDAIFQHTQMPAPRPAVAVQL